MDKKHSKRKHRERSPNDDEHHRKHRKHGHHRDREVEDNHHSDNRQRQHRDDDRDDRHDNNRNSNRNNPHHSSRKHRERTEQYDPNMRIKQERNDAANANFAEQQRERSHHDARRQEQRRARDRNGASDFTTSNSNSSNQPTNNNTEQQDIKEEEEEPVEKENPNFGLSGKLTEDTNTFRGVVIKYNEPPEAMMPKRKWRLYPFKGETAFPVLHIHRQSAFLLGRDRKIADIPVDHPSCSKQHAVLQFRAINFTRDDGSTGRRVRPFIIDLESANGTYLNNEQIEAKRYYELKEKDMIKFGFSTREYVILHDNVDLSEVAGGSESD